MFGVWALNSRSESDKALARRYAGPLRFPFDVDVILRSHSTRIPAVPARDGGHGSNYND